MTELYIGNKEVNDIYAGNKMVKTVYKGNELLYMRFKGLYIAFSSVLAIIGYTTDIDIYISRDLKIWNLVKSIHSPLQANAFIIGYNKNIITVYCTDGASAINEVATRTCFYSYDGINWSSRSCSNIPERSKGIYFRNGLFYFLSVRGYYSVSQDCLNWTLKTFDNVPINGGIEYDEINDSYVYLVNGRPYYSNDGNNWIATSTSLQTGDAEIIYNKGIFIIYSRYERDDSRQNYYYSTDGGHNWTQSLFPFLWNSIGLQKGQKYFYLTIADENNIQTYRSSDGINWESCDFSGTFFTDGNYTYKTDATWNVISPTKIYKSKNEESWTEIKNTDLSFGTGKVVSFDFWKEE